MVAYLIAHIGGQDSDQWQIYVDPAGTTLALFGAEVMLCGRRAAVLASKHAHETVTVLKFPEAASTNRWYQSDAYQALAYTRNRASDVVNSPHRDGLNCVTSMSFRATVGARNPSKVRL